MTNYEFQQQLAIDIAADGFAKHATLAANFVSLLHDEKCFLYDNAGILVAAVKDTSLPEVVRCRAFGKLRLAATGQAPVVLDRLVPTAPLLRI